MTLSPAQRPDGIVLHIVGCRSIQYGSFEDNLVALARACSQRGMQALFAYPEPPIAEQFTDDVAAAGGRVIVAPHTDEASMRGVRAILKVIRSTRPKIVHAHFGRPGYLAVLIARLVGVRRVLLMKHHESWPAISSGHRIALRAVAAMADAILCVSPVVEDEVLAAGAPTRKVRVTPLGINAERYAPHPQLRPAVRRTLGYAPDETVVLAVSHLRVPKGMDVLVEAWDEVASCAPKARLLVAGGGPLLEELVQQAAALPHGESIRFLGVRQDVPDLLASCDLFVCPSLSEAGGLNIAEALSAGIPTVSTLVGVVKRLGNEGLFVPVPTVGDPDVLAASIQSALEQDDLRADISVRGRDYVVRNLTLRNTTDRIADIYEDGTLATGGVPA